MVTLPYTQPTFLPIHGGRVMLLVDKDISHMPITEMENDSESVGVKVFANKTSHFVASWYRPPGSTSEEFQLFRVQLDYIRTHHKGKKLPSDHLSLQRKNTSMVTRILVQYRGTLIC